MGGNRKIAKSASCIQIKLLWDQASDQEYHGREKKLRPDQTSSMKSRTLGGCRIRKETDRKY